MVINMMPPRLTIPLIYTSNEKCESHRLVAPRTLPSSSISYDLKPVERADNSGYAPQKRFADALVFVPQLTIKGNFSVKAVIDRMIILLVTRDKTSCSGILNGLAAAGIKNCFVSDRIANRGDIKWRGAINLPPEMQLGYDSGRVFAVLMQEPSPQKLTSALKVIEDRWGIVGDVKPFLLEVSLDFYARKNLSPDNRIILREQMVGLLQRHHFFEPKGSLSWLGDARQVYSDPVSMHTKTDFLFSSPRGSTRRYADSEVNDAWVRNRLQHGRHDNQLFLDATLYKGCQPDHLQVSIQHKIEDERNSVAGTSRVLADADRRARIEVEMSGKALLEDGLNISVIGAMKDLAFRKIKKRYLTFWFPTTSAEPTEQMNAWKQFQARGLYGTEHMNRLTAWERKEATKAARSKPGTTTIHQRVGTGITANLIAWEECNEAVGDALDSLRKVWRTFDWS